MYNSCIPVPKRGTTKYKVSAWKVTIEEMECINLVVTKGENLQWSFANEHRTEAETKSDSQVESLMNVAEFKANFMGKLYYY